AYSASDFSASYALVSVVSAAIAASAAARAAATRAAAARLRGRARRRGAARSRSEEHTSELQSLAYLVCRLLLEKKKNYISDHLFSLNTDWRGLRAILVIVLLF